MREHFMVKVLRNMGHETFAFYRNKGVLPLMEQLSNHPVGRGIGQYLPKINPDFHLRNHRLIDQVRHLQPDVIIIHNDNESIFPSTLAQIKEETDAVLVTFSGVSPVVFSHANERACALHYDLAVVNDFYHGMQWRELGVPNMVVLPIAAIDPDFHHPYDLSPDERLQYACDVGFSGTLLYDHLYGKRIKMLSALREFDLGIWSVHAIPPVLQPYAKGSALGQEMMRVLGAAKISINIHGDFMLYGGNMRLFELAAIGTFQIVDNLPGIPEWFTPGEHLVTFKDADDLREKVAYYLTHPEERQKIADAARKHVYAHHTYRQRMERLVDIISEIR